MADWKRIYEEFESLTDDQKEELKRVFLLKTREKLKTYFMANPYAQKVYEEKLGLVWRPPLTPSEIEKLKKEYKRKFEIEIREKGFPIRESLLKFEDLYRGWSEDVLHLAFKTKDEALERLEDEIQELVGSLARKYKPEILPAKIIAPPWDHGSMMNIWWDIRASIFDAAGIKPDIYRDEAFRLMAQCRSEAEARVKLREWAEEKVRLLTKARRAPTRPTDMPPPPSTAPKPPAIGPLDWVKYVKKLTLGEFYNLPDEKRKQLMEEYDKYVEENRRKQS